MDIAVINRGVIEQFRAGREVEGMHRDRLLLLTTTGRRSGLPRTCPMMFHREDGQVLVVASNMGAPQHPDWYRNLVADPAVTVELPDATVEALARTVEGGERERLLGGAVCGVPVLRRARGRRGPHDPGGRPRSPLIAGCGR